MLYFGTKEIYIDINAMFTRDDAIQAIMKAAELPTDAYSVKNNTSNELSYVYKDSGRLFIDAAGGIENNDGGMTIQLFGPKLKKYWFRDTETFDQLLPLIAKHVRALHLYCKSEVKINNGTFKVIVQDLREGTNSITGRLSSPNGSWTVRYRNDSIYLDNPDLFPDQMSDYTYLVHQFFIPAVKELTAKDKNETDV